MRIPNEVLASLAQGLLQERVDDMANLATSDPTAFVQTFEYLNWVELFLAVDRGATRLLTRVRPQTSVAGRTIGKWTRACRQVLRRQPRIGLIGTSNLKGLGHLNRDLVRWLRIEDWLLPESSEESYSWAKTLAPRVERLETAMSSSESRRRFLDRIDVLMFVERPFDSSLLQVVRQRGGRVVCVPMWEWLHPGVEWLPDVDLMLCPTRMTQRLLDGWKRRFGFEWKTRYCPWPIDVDSFSFRPRTTCRRFVMVNGAPSHPQRKGLDLLVEAARRLPSIPFLIWSQTKQVPPAPANVEFRHSVGRNCELYETGDVCVQFSRWEGLGLPLLECQAAGMPLITMDAGPMNEHNPLDVVPVHAQEVIAVLPRRPIVVPCVRVEDAVSVLATWFGRDVESASHAARKYVEREHSWSLSRQTILATLAECFWSRS